MHLEGSVDISQSSVFRIIQPLLKDLPAPSLQNLLALYARAAQQGDDASQHSIDGLTRITPDEGLELLRLAKNSQANSLLEVGLAYGFSSQFLLSALYPLGGRLISIDPYQSSEWHGIGRRLAIHTAQALTVDLGSEEPLRFECLEDRSDLALPQLNSQGESFDMIFIDGSHRFDDVLIDVTMSVHLCREGGLIVLHDLLMPSVRTVVGFLEANRVDLLREPTPCWNLAVFRRLGNDPRDSNHFIPFSATSRIVTQVA